jgi:D-hexose-6-phosphate mutarotase
MTPPLPATVRREPGIGCADLLIVEAPGSTARIHTYGAHVVSWVPRGAADVLWLSPLADSTPGAAIRGGVPLCFPWFGPHPTGGGAAHGFARVSVWRLVEAASASASAPDGDLGAADGGHAADDVALTLELTEQDVDPTLATAWPHPFTARLRIVVGQRLTLSLTVTNTGDHPITVSEALHTYLAVGDVRRAEVRGLEGAVHVDAADGGPRLPRHDGTRSRRRAGPPPGQRRQVRVGVDRRVEPRARARRGDARRPRRRVDLDALRRDGQRPRRRPAPRAGRDAHHDHPDQRRWRGLGLLPAPAH